MFTVVCLGVILLVVGLFLLIWKFLFEVVVVDGESMMPTLKDGDLVLIKKFHLDLKTDDICVYTSPDGTEVIKRLKKHFDVDLLYFQGDNKDFSRDSRHYGFVAENDIIGKVIWRRK